MRRRTYLSGVAVGLTALSGCGSLGSQTGTDTATTDDSATPRPPTLAGTELPVDRSEITFAAPTDVFAAIVDPVFGPDWEGVTLPNYAGDGARPRLASDDRIIGVTRDGAARAYPLRLLFDHEIVNDDFGGPLLVTYCPLCGSGVTAERFVDGEPTTFGVSGKLWNSDLLMYDQRTESYWSQILATAIRGPQTGDTLDLLPSTLTTWGQWREAHPETVVLRPPPESGTIDDSGPQFYSDDFDAGYRNASVIGVGENDFQSDRLPAKSVVLGVEHGDRARAYPRSVVRNAGVIHDSLGSLPLVVTHDEDTLVAYDRRVDGTTLTFERAADGTLRGGGSRWRILTGEAIDGTYEGTSLESVHDVSQLLWFAWVQHHPETTLYEIA